MIEEEPSGLALASRFQAEELANAITHGIGLALSVVGAVALLISASSRGDVWLIAGCGVFATTLVALYAASTLSHSVSRPPLRHWFRRLDHGAIYLLIVGTYTPFALAYLRSGWWLSFFGLMWTIALCGLLSKVLFSHRVEAVAIWSYLLLGWMPVVTVRSLVESIPAVVLWWMLIGGLCYTVGTVFLIYDDRRPFFHAIWHAFVIAGSMSHFFAIFLLVTCS